MAKASTSCKADISDDPVIMIDDEDIKLDPIVELAGIINKREAEHQRCNVPTH